MLILVFDTEGTSSINKIKMYGIDACSTMVVSGVSNSGKTRFVYRLLKEKEAMFPKNPPVNILYCFGIYQPFYDKIEIDTGAVMHPGLPSREDVEELTSNGQHNLIVMDDLMTQVMNSDFAKELFTMYSHHKSLSIIAIIHNMYEQGKCSRSISLNTKYLCLFANPRDVSQIECLGRQIGYKNLSEAYRDATSKPYGYLFVDLSPHCPEQERLRTDIFPNETTALYIKKK